MSYANTEMYCAAHIIDLCETPDGSFRKNAEFNSRSFKLNLVLQWSKGSSFSPLLMISC